MLDNCVAVAMGNEGQFGALGADGSLYGWGNPHLHGCGVAHGDPGLTEDYMDTEHGIFYIIKPFKILSDVKMFTMGAWNGMAVKNDGTVWFWGPDSWYEKNYNGGPAQTPVQLNGIQNIKSIMLYNEGAFCIKTDGTLQKWGEWVNGRHITYKNPVTVAENVAMVTSDSVGNYALMLKPDGNLFFIEGNTWLAGNVQWVSHGFSNGDYSETFFVLKNDGTLYSAVPESDANHNLVYPLKLVASNVALSGQPLSAVRSRAKAVGGFADVNEADYFADPVLWAVQRGITNGTTQASFSPGRPCTVAEILTFLWRSQGSPAPRSVNPFMDVPPGQYYTDASVWAYERGLVEGSRFNGSAPCTRGMAVTYLWKLAGSPKISDHIYYYSDVPTSLKDPVTWATDQKITQGIEKTAFSAMAFGPDLTCTRGQIVTFLYRAYANT